MSECGKVKGAFTNDVVNIGWYGHKNTKNAYIRVGPGDHYTQKLKISPHKHVGVQSARNPKGVDNPPKRPIVRDEGGRPWVWVYHEDVSGWMKLSVLQETWDSFPWARGPYSSDFHVGLEPCPTKPKSSCLGSRRNRVRTIAEEVALRYAPHSTAFHYLQRGDGIRELYRRLQNDFSAVTVTHSKTTPIGTRGWVDVRSLVGEKASGISVSALQDGIDFQAVRGSGQDFVVCKATEGESFVDANYFRNIKEARQAFLHVGAYHVLAPRPGRSGTEEAEDFIRALRLAKIGSTDIRPAVKVQKSLLNRDRTQRYVGEFVGALRIAGYDSMLLTYPSFVEWTVAFNTDLWIENYGVSEPALPEPWDDYVLWLYAKGPLSGVRGQVDRNKCPDLSRIIQR